MTDKEKNEFINLLEKELRVNAVADFEIADNMEFNFAIPGLFILIQCEFMPWKTQNLATQMGWRILRFTPQSLCTNVTVEIIRKTILRSCEFINVNNNIES